MALDRDDKIVVTGGTGFLGSFIVERLGQLGFRNAIPLGRKDFDLTLAPQVDQLYQQHRPACVINLAAEVGGIGANREKPGRFFFSNMSMGLNLIEGARKFALKKFVQVGTVCAYPKFTPVPFKEDELWNGYPEETNAPYGIAKKALLVMCQAYRQQYGLNAIYLLPVNLFGPRDNFDLGSGHVIPALIRKCVEARDRGDSHITAWGTGSASREFLYVADCAEAVVAAAEKYDSADPMNLGSGKEITIRKLTELIASISGFRGGIEWDATKPDGQPRRCLDISRARDRIGFMARTSFEEGLKKTIDWYEAHSALSNENRSQDAETR